MSNSAGLYWIAAGVVSYALRASEYPREGFLSASLKARLLIPSTLGQSQHTCAELAEVQSLVDDARTMCSLD